MPETCKEWWSNVHVHTGCMQSEMDWEVGEVMAALKEAGVDKDTFVFLTSDNGQVLHRWRLSY